MRGPRLQLGDVFGKRLELDGVLVAEFRGSKHRRLTLTPGRHTLSVRPFMEEEALVSGVLDTRDILYYVSVATIAVAVGTFSLESRRWT